MPDETIRNTDLESIMSKYVSKTGKTRNITKKENDLCNKELINDMLDFLDKYNIETMCLNLNDNFSCAIPESDIMLGHYSKLNYLNMDIELMAKLIYTLKYTQRTLGIDETVRTSDIHKILDNKHDTINKEHIYTKIMTTELVNYIKNSDIPYKSEFQCFEYLFSIRKAYNLKNLSMEYQFNDNFYKLTST